MDVCDFSVLLTLSIFFFAEIRYLLASLTTFFLDFSSFSTMSMLVFVGFIDAPSLSFLCLFEVPDACSTTNIWYVYLSWPWILFYKVLYRNLVHVHKNFLLTTHYQYQTSHLISQTFPESYISWYFSLFFIIQILSTDCGHCIFDIIQIPTCFFNPLT